MTWIITSDQVNPPGDAAITYDITNAGLNFHDTGKHCWCIIDLSQLCPRTLGVPSVLALPAGAASAKTFGVSYSEGFLL